MTGRIKSLGAGNACGFIRAEDGGSVYFHAAAVLAHDIAALSVGQFVTFDLESGACPRAANVCVLRQHAVAGAPAKRPDSVQFRYMGFDQSESTRAYKFQRVAHGEEPRTFIVTTDLALFRKHRVGIQEGPGLCLRALMAELPGAASAPQPLLPRALTDEDLLAHLASRPVPARRPRPKVPPRSHPGWHPV